MLAGDRPYVFVVSPPCTFFFHLQSLRQNRQDFDGQGRCFHFEHPTGASSWNVTDLAALKMCEDVENVFLHMGAFNLTTQHKFLNKRLVLNTTHIVTNMPRLAERLCKRCSRDHRHVPLMSGKAKNGGILYG